MQLVVKKLETNKIVEDEFNNNEDIVQHDCAKVKL